MHRSISVISLPSIGFIAAVMVISSLLLETVSAGCLREDGQPLCCLGRDNTCLSKGPRLKGNDSKLCYCDELCISAGDCCSDFPQACLREYLFCHLLTPTMPLFVYNKFI